MSTIHVEVSEVVNASPEVIYGILSDYRVGHPAILPKPYFTRLDVEQGGQGEGTVIRVDMSVFGQKRSYHMNVTEPEPGHILMETDHDAGVVTTFKVEPVRSGQQTRLTIVTDSRASAGVAGFMERLMNPPIARRIYRKEIQNIADYAQRNQS